MVRPRLVPAVSLVMALAFSALVEGAEGHDFSRAQRIYVPPSLINRRVDSSFMGGRPSGFENWYSNPNQSYSGSYGGTVPPYGTGTTYIPPAAPRGRRQPSASGLVPPPPPTIPLYLPPPSISGLVPAAPLPPSPKTRVPPRKPASARKAPSLKGAPASANASAINSAKQLSRQGRFDAAAELLRDALRLSPRDAQLSNALSDVYVEQARALMARKDFDAALKAARSALLAMPSHQAAAQILDSIHQQNGIDPRNVDQRLKIADTLAAQGRNESASVEYRQSLKVKPTAHAHVGLGNLSVRNNQSDYAIKSYAQALELDHDSAEAHRQLGLVHKEKGDLVAANRHLSKALTIDGSDKPAAQALIELWQQQVSRRPENAESHLGLARAYQLSGDLKSAQAEYKQVVRLDPNHPNLPAARQSFKAALHKQEAFKSLQAANTLEAAGALPAAYQKLVEAVSLSPFDASLRVHQGQLLEKMGQLEQARDAYMAALKEDPHNMLAAQRVHHLSTPPVVPVAGRADAGTGSAWSPPPLRPPQYFGQPIDDVSKLSGFLYSLRNFSLAEQKRLETLETAHRKMFDAVGDALTHSPTTIASLTGQRLPAVPAADGASHTLATVAPTIPLRGPISSSSGTEVAQPATAQPADQMIDQLDQQSKALKKQVEQALGAAQQGTAGGAPDSLVPPVAPPLTTVKDGSEAVPPLAPPFVRGGSAVAAAPQPVPYATRSQPPAQVWLPTGEAVPLVSRQAASTTNAFSPVKFQLEGLRPALNGVQLAVVLKNEQDVELVLPAAPQAIIRTPGRPEARVKVYFPQKVVPAHGEVRGTIKVPAKNADPASDCILPNLLPPSSASRDVHLTVSL